MGEEEELRTEINQQLDQRAEYRERRGARHAQSPRQRRTADNCERIRRNPGGFAAGQVKAWLDFGFEEIEMLMEAPAGDAAEFAINAVKVGKDDQDGRED